MCIRVLCLAVGCARVFVPVLLWPLYLHVHPCCSSRALLRSFLATSQHGLRLTTPALLVRPEVIDTRGRVVDWSHQQVKAKREDEHPTANLTRESPVQELTKSEFGPRTAIPNGPSQVTGFSNA